MTMVAGRRMQWTELPDCFPRHYFAQNVFDYEAGQHVVFGGPTQVSGKTQLAFDLLEYVATPECPAYVAVSKPQDKVTSYYAKLYDWPIVRSWPPVTKFKHLFSKPTGYVIWPQFGDLYRDRENVKKVLGGLIAERYGASAQSKRGRRVKGILVMDDTRDKSKVAQLDYEMTTVLAMAGAMGLGEWCFVQKPSQAGDTALMSYSAADHLFLFRDPTVKGREYYGEIGGVDPNYIDWVLQHLEKRQALYIRRSGPELAIVDADSRHGAIKEPK